MIFGIADLHFDSIGDKSMDIFGENWIDHENKIINNWRNIVKEDDLVLVPGDISWALKLEDGYKDLLKLESLPGKKILVKGNHDYWWQSLSKINNLGLETIKFLQNNSFTYGDIAVAGTRGWTPIDEHSDSHHMKIFTRELNRLRLSLDSIKKDSDIIIALLHYPPFNYNMKSNEFVDIMKEYGVDICLYGHLHADGHKYVVEGNIEGIEFHCISSDYIDFIPKKIL